ncbi:MAG: magnesium transporter [Pseudomonadota bacterium]
MSDTPNPEDSSDEPSRVDPVLAADISDAVGEGDRRWLSRTLARLHPADAADALEQLSTEAFETAVELLGGELPADILIELRDEYREDAVEALPDEVVAEVLDELDSDDATVVLEDLEDDRRERILQDLDPTDRAALEQGLAFDEETAGRLMQREFVAAPEFWTVGHTVDHARGMGDELPDQFFDVYVVDPGFRLKGEIPLSTILRTPRDVMLADIMVQPKAKIRPDMDQEEVAFLFQKYDMVSAPVVDAAERITGMITIDDMVDVIQDENTEDLLALSNVTSADGSDSAWDVVRARAPWLGINVFTAFIASGIISMFEPALEQIVALAILMPVVAALAGNAGSQALAVAVRAIAEREMQGAAAARAVRREALAGAANGVLFAISVGLVAFAWFRDLELALVIAAAMFATFVWAGLSGILVPLTLKRLGADPAVASSVFVLTLTDAMAFFSFLGLATLILLA